MQASKTFKSGQGTKSRNGRLATVLLGEQGNTQNVRNSYSLWRCKPALQNDRGNVLAEKISYSCMPQTLRTCRESVARAHNRAMHALNGNAAVFWRTPALLVYESGEGRPTKATIAIREPFRCRPSLERERKKQWRKNELPASYTASRPAQPKQDVWKWKSRWYLSLGTKSFAEALIREQTLHYYLLREDNGFSARAQLTHNREVHARNGNIKCVLWLLLALVVAAELESDLEMADVISDLMKENEQLRARLASGRFTRLDLNDIRDRAVASVSVVVKPMLQGLLGWVDAVIADSPRIPAVVSAGRELASKARRFYEDSKQAYAQAVKDATASPAYLKARELQRRLVDRVSARLIELSNRIVGFVERRGRGAIEKLCAGRLRAMLYGLCPAPQEPSTAPLAQTCRLSDIDRHSNETLGTCPAPTCQATAPPSVRAMLNVLAPSAHMFLAAASIPSSYLSGVSRFVNETLGSCPAVGHPYVGVAEDQ